VGGVLAACLVAACTGGSAPAGDPGGTRAATVTGATGDATDDPTGDSTGDPTRDPTGGPPADPSGSSAAGDAYALSGRPGAAEDLATGLAVPWDVARIAGDLLVTERDSGRVLRVEDSGGPTPVTVDGRDTVPGVVADGEGGLLGLAELPDGDVAVYTSTATDNRVLRFAYDPAGPSLTGGRVLLDGIPRARVHNGGRLAVGPDGFLYVTTGDARDVDEAQDPASLAGKILRVTPDGLPAPGNPFPGSPVWSYGHRNVQGLGWLADGTMVASEFGQDTWDEVNVIEPGANYGWPVVEGPGGTDRGFVDPVVAWPPAEASPSGLAVTGDAVYVAALRGQRLWRIPAGDGGLGEPEALLAGEFGRLRDVEADPASGSLLVLTNNTARGEPRDGDDRLLRVRLGAG
jgi:glucose/arabinose dehydrogenase